MYSVLNTLPEHRYFYISKNITSYFFACFQNGQKPVPLSSLIDKPEWVI